MAYPNHQLHRAQTARRTSRYLVAFLLAAAGVASGCTRSRDADLMPNGATRYPAPVADSQFGFIDTTGKLVIAARFSSAGDFHEGLAPVVVGKKKGYIDESGALVIAPRFESAGSFVDGVAAVSEDGKRYGYIDHGGKTVIAPQFDHAAPFYGGLAAVTVGTRAGYIDHTGKLVITPQFDDAGLFSDGRAAVKVGGRYGFIDAKGKFVINPQYEQASPFFAGLAPVKSGDRWGYIDPDGNTVIAPQFDAAYVFTDQDLAPVKFDTLWGYVNRKGKLVINPQFSAAYPFTHGLASATIGGKCGWINAEGKFEVVPQFADCAPFDGRVLSALTKAPEGGSQSAVVYLTRAGRVIWQQDTTRVSAANTGNAASSEQEGGDAGTTAPATPAPGTRHTIAMIGDEQGYRFEPSAITIHEGDTLRFVNSSGGPHNVAFDPETLSPRARAAIDANMPSKTSELTGFLLTEPDQGYTISFAGVPPGTYSAYCIPHLALGMRIQITVVPRA